MFNSLLSNEIRLSLPLFLLNYQRFSCLKTLVKFPNLMTLLFFLRQRDGDARRRLFDDLEARQADGPRAQPAVHNQGGYQHHRHRQSKFLFVKVVLV